MNSRRHSGQAIRNDDGFNPAKILDDLNAKSVREFEDQNIFPFGREGTGMLNPLCCFTVRPGKMKFPELPRRIAEWPL